MVRDAAVVGWGEPAKPNNPDALGFTFVQPNLRALRSRLPRLPDIGFFRAFRVFRGH